MILTYCTWYNYMDYLFECPARIYCILAWSNSFLDLHYSLTRVTTCFSARLFADDLHQLHVVQTFIVYFIKLMLNFPIYIHDWLCANKLTINLNKTKYIIFQPWQKLNSNVDLPLTLASQLAL